MDHTENALSVIEKDLRHLHQVMGGEVEKAAKECQDAIQKLTGVGRIVAVAHQMLTALERVADKVQKLKQSS